MIENEKTEGVRLDPSNVFEMVVRAAGRHLSGNGEHNGVVDGVHQVVDGSLRLIQFNKGGISRYLCVADP
mgnify:CR=1 FL=1